MKKITLFRLCFPVLLLFSLAALPATAEKVQRLDIVDRAIEFHGGALYRGSEVRLRVSSRSGGFQVVSTVDGDSFEHVVSGKLRSGVVRKVRQTNTSLEQWNDGEPVELDDDGRRRAQSFVEARVYFSFLPYGLNDENTWKEDQGLEDWDGRKLHRVKVTFEAGSSNSAHDEYVFWFDSESGRLEQYAYSFGTGRDNGGLRFRPLSEYRRVGGILFFDATNLGVDGSGELRVDQITPAYVKEKMEHVSFVNLTGLKVKPVVAER
ncbi:MAG: hypothetical protein K0U98_13945 [Deltaproteobacteria bacterium]|nr:hypothetical protein [Deltaproteobacteria bacterium]